MRRLKTVATGLFLLGAVVIGDIGPAQAGDRWVKLGSREVTDRAEGDRIGVGARRFDDIRLCVRRTAVRFYDVTVRFENGGKQDVALRRVVPKGDCTRAIDLKGSDRNIDAVLFRYEAASLGRKRAVVTLFGR